MKQIMFIIFIICGTAFFGCSSSEETEKQNTPPPPPAVEKPVENRVIKTEPPAMKKTDTLNVDIQNTEKPRYEPAPPPDAQAAPAGKFSVQIGAYKMPDNADRIGGIAKERFGLKVYSSYDSKDKLYKVMIGDFETKDAARNFRDVMSMKFPEDYKGAWVSENQQK